MKPTISLQMYTLRELTQIDMLGTLEKVAALGYQGIEMAGYGNADLQSVTAKLHELGLAVTGNHVGIELLENDDSFQNVLAENRVLDNEFIIVGYVDESRRGSLEKWLQTAETLDKVGRKLHEAGLKLCYHNHAFEFEEQYEGVPCEALDQLRHGTRHEGEAGRPAERRQGPRALSDRHQPNPMMRLFRSRSAPPAAKSSNACSVTRMMWRSMNGAPSAAPCSGCLSAHSHSSTAQPLKSFAAILEKIAPKSTCPSPSERKRPGRSTQLWYPP
ncbi:MAG: sugar phosphate isomerase/epimerase [Zymomonas sp.]|nr:MAG: sugar phosphate isomerase/epimerase [Zymomonas sp.]